jgi:hypothetical protein
MNLGSGERSDGHSDTSRSHKFFLISSGRQSREYIEIAQSEDKSSTIQNTPSGTLYFCTKPWQEARFFSPFSGTLHAWRFGNCRQKPKVGLVAS